MLRARLGVWRRVFVSPLSKVLAVLLALHTVFAVLYWLAVNKAWIAASDSAVDRSLAVVLQWSPATWSIVVLACVVLVLLEGSYRVIRRVEERLDEVVRQRPLVRGFWLKRAEPDPQHSVVYLRVVNEGAKASFYSTVEASSAAGWPFNGWPAGMVYGRWQNHPERSINLVEHGEALIVLAVLFRADTNKAYWTFVEGPYVPPKEVKPGVTVSGFGEHTGFAFPLAEDENEPYRSTTVDVRLYADPAMLDGPINARVVFRGPGAALVEGSAV